MKTNMRYFANILRNFDQVSWIKKNNVANAVTCSRHFSSAKCYHGGYFNDIKSDTFAKSECTTAEDQLKFHKPDGWITLNEFKHRRRELASRIIQSFKNASFNPEEKFGNIHRHLVIVPASEKQYMVGKIPYTYRQSTDFRYLTGHLFPDAALLLDIEYEGKKVG